MENSKYEINLAQEFEKSTINDIKNIKENIKNINSSDINSWKILKLAKNN